MNYQLMSVIVNWKIFTAKQVTAVGFDGEARFVETHRTVIIHSVVIRVNYIDIIGAIIIRSIIIQSIGP